MDIEKARRKELISKLNGNFYCIEECELKLVGFDEILRADVVAVSQSEDDAWILAFEVKEPTGRWELKNWTKALKQAGDYPNCIVTDKRAGHAVGKLVSASFIFPGPDLLPWDHEASQETRFYRKYDAQPLYGAIILAQLFKVGIAQHDRKNGKLSLKFGTDPVWDNRLGFRKKAEGLLERRRVGSTKRKVAKS